MSDEIIELVLVKDIMLDWIIEKRGTPLHAIKVNDDTYKVFHFTGWWAIPKEYFEEE